MNIILKEIPIRDVFSGYQDLGNDGVVGYGGKLDIRPPFQREFVYKDVQRNLVLDTVIRNYPLNIMYWAVREDGDFEVIDGQQRTISICQFLNGNYSINHKYVWNLSSSEVDDILDYMLMVYWCEGTPEEKLEWFKTINIAGAQLTSQELNNAVYSGPWVTSAKRYFSKIGSPAGDVGGDYLTGSAIRQEYLETAIDWISDGQIKDYMARNQLKNDAKELWDHFLDIIKWIKTTFPNYRKEMKGLDWGKIYRTHAGSIWNPVKLEAEIYQLMIDEDVTSKKGIFEYVLSGNTRLLSIRAFSEKQKREAYERQKGICPVCNKEFKIEEMEGDHITPWHLGGQTISDNCQMLCKSDNRTKGGI